MFFYLIPYKQMYLLFKSKFFILLQVIGAFLLPIKPLILLVGMMILIDTVSGIWKAKKIGEKITSHKLSRVISKMVLYQVGLITFFILEKYLLGEFVQSFTSIQFFLTKIVAIFFCGIEMTSINENIKRVKGINLFQMFKSMLTRVKEVKDEFVEIGLVSSTTTVTNQTVTDKTLTVTKTIDVVANPATTI